MTRKQARIAGPPASGTLNRRNDGDQFAVTHGGAIVATGTRDQVWTFTATHDGVFAVRVAS
jgi:hypothetical protein